MNGKWPELDYPSWQATCAALQLYAQMLGKYRLARTPWVNHSWHATLYPTARGLTTGLVQDGEAGIELVLDLIDHQVAGSAGAGATASFALQPMSASDFHARLLKMIRTLGGTPEFHGRPNEIADGVPFAQDHTQRPYDAEAVTRFFRACVAVTGVLQTFRTGFLGKVSPVHFFWGSFDLAVTRFSGRPAPRHPGGIPALPDAVTQEAYSHEVSSAGFWPGGGATNFPAFYSYAYPAPAGFAEAAVSPSAACFDKMMGEFILPYEAVRTASDPEATLMAFLESTYRAAADLGRWDRLSLECPIGQARQPRPVARGTGNR